MTAEGYNQKYFLIKYDRVTNSATGIRKPTEESGLLGVRLLPGPCKLAIIKDRGLLSVLDLASMRCYKLFACRL